MGRAFLQPVKEADSRTIHNSLACIVIESFEAPAQGF
jgi:hypothetical protein